MQQPVSYPRNLSGHNQQNTWYKQALHIARNWFTKAELHFLNKFTHEWLPLPGQPSCKQCICRITMPIMQPAPGNSQTLSTVYPTWLTQFVKSTTARHSEVLHQTQQPIPQPNNDLLTAGLWAGRNTNSEVPAYVQQQVTIQHTSQQ